MTRIQEAREHLAKYFAGPGPVDQLGYAVALILDELSESAAGRREAAISKTETTEREAEPGGGEAGAMLAETVRIIRMRLEEVATVLQLDFYATDTGEFFTKMLHEWSSDKDRASKAEAELAAAKGRIEELEAELAAERRV